MGVGRECFAFDQFSENCILHTLHYTLVTRVCVGIVYQICKSLITIW